METHQITALKKRFSEQYRATLQGLPSIGVLETMSGPHPFVRIWLADHDRAMEAAKRFRSSPFPRLTELDHRRYRILDALFKELERRGAKIHASQFEAPRVQIGGERVDFRLYEKKRRVPRSLTDEEKTSWLHARQKSRWGEVPTGRLTFKITTHLGSGIPVEWIDSDRPIEQQLTEIIAAFIVAGPVLSEKSRQLEAERQRYERAERRRSLKIARKEREHSRWERFLEIAAEWRDAEDARQFLARLEMGSSADHKSYGRRSHADWLAWVRTRLKAYDPVQNGAGAIWQDLADVPLEGRRSVSALADIDEC